MLIYYYSGRLSSDGYIHFNLQIRLSVGLEDEEDLIEDLKQALEVCMVIFLALLLCLL